MSTKDVYGSMAPMPYVRGLGASTSKPRQSPPPAIAGRPHAPSLRGQIGRLKRRKRSAGVKALVDARGRLSGVEGLDDEAMAIYRTAMGLDQPARDLTGIKTAMARIETKERRASHGDEHCTKCSEPVGAEYDVVDGGFIGFPGDDAIVCLSCKSQEPELKGAPSRMPPQLIQWWAGPGQSRWATNPHPYTALVRQLRAHDVPAHMVNGAAANVMKRAWGVYPAQRPGMNSRGHKSLQDALARL